MGIFVVGRAGSLEALQGKPCRLSTYSCISAYHTLCAYLGTYVVSDCPLIDCWSYPVKQFLLGHYYGKTCELTVSATNIPSPHDSSTTLQVIRLPPCICPLPLCRCNAEHWKPRLSLLVFQAAFHATRTIDWQLRRLERADPHLQLVSLHRDMGRVFAWALHQ